MLQHLTAHQNLPTTWWQDIFLITVLLSLFFSVFMGVRPLSVPDEARYSEIAREMVTSGDYITPRLNTVKYFEKPAFFYWAEAASIRLFGLSEAKLRLPTLLFGLIGCLATYMTARSLFDRRTGWLATFILATSVLYFSMAHTITLDMPVSVFLTLCLSCFILAVDMPLGLRRNLLLWGMYAFGGFAVLTKGLIGILLPATVMGSWILFCNQWRCIPQLNLFSGIGLFLMIVAPWHLLVQQANPEFFHFYFIEQQFLRYLTLSAKRYQPDWFFVPILILGFFPWIVFLFQALRHHWPTQWRDRIPYKKSIFLMIWTGVIFVFFSLSKSKLIPYILPMFPPLAILVGHMISDEIEKPSSFFPKAFLAIFSMAILISVSLFLISYFDEVNDITLSNVFLCLMAICLLAGTFFAMLYAYRGLIKAALALLLSTMMMFLILANFTVAAVDTRSIKPLMIVLIPQLKSSDEVVAYHHYYQDLPFYLQRRVTVVDCRDELSFGMHHQDTHVFMIDDTEFWRRFHSAQRVYAVMRLNVYKNVVRSHADMHLLAATKDNVLVKN